MNKKFRASLSMVLVLAVAGCSGIRSASNDVKSAVVRPAPSAGFIGQPERQVNRVDLPFQKVWIKPGLNLGQYRELVVAPVNTQYMQEMGWLHRLSTANLLRNVERDIESLAQYFHDQVVTRFKEDPQHRFRVVEDSGERKAAALRLELALIEINPSTPVLHALSWAGPIGTRSAAGVVNRRRAAFEGRLRDLETDAVIATFADRDMADVGPLDLTRLTWYGPARGIMDRWANQFVQIANRESGEIVSDPTPFTLRPF